MPKFIGPSGVVDNGARAYSDSNAPGSFEFTLASEPASPVAGETVLWSPAGKSLLMKAPDGTVTMLGPSEDNVAGPTDHGYKGWAFDPVIINGTGQPTAGGMNIVRIPIRAPISLASCSVLVATAGASLANAGFALYSAAGALLKSSVNTRGATATAFQSTGMKVITWDAPITVSTDVYVGFWFTGTTMPAINKAAATGAASNLNLAAPNLRFATITGSYTTTAPATLTTQSAGPAAYWVGVA